MTNIKKLLAVLLCLVMAVSLFACGGNNGGTSEKPPVDITGNTTPIKIEWWMTFEKGANYENLMKIVEEFNKNNPYNIEVVPSYQGAYAAVLAKVQTDIAAGTNPVLGTMSESGAGTLGLNGQLQDLTPYIKRDKANFADFHDALTQQLLVHDVDNDKVEEILGLPYCRSVSLAYHNMKLWAAVGITDKSKVPTTIEQLVPPWNQIHEKTGAYGIAMAFDPSYYQCGLIQSLAKKNTGKTNGGVIGTSGEDCPALTDGTMLKVMSDWASWCDEGFAWRTTVTDASNTMNALFWGGQVATIFASSGGMGTYIKNFTENASGLTIDDLHATIQPGYGGFGGRGGGGNLGIIPANHTPEEIDAAWKFIQYAAMDAEVTARSAITTGYVCTTKSGLATQTMKDALAAQPLLAVANNGVNNAFDATLGYARSNWNTRLKAFMSTIITDPENKKSVQELLNELVKEAPGYLDPDKMV